MSSQWMVRTTEGEVGPFSLDDLQAYASSGELTPDDCIRPLNASEYVLAGSLNGLFGSLHQEGSTEIATDTQWPVSHALTAAAGLFILRLSLPSWGALPLAFTAGVAGVAAWHGLILWKSTRAGRRTSVGPAVAWGCVWLLGIALWPARLGAHPIFNTPLTAAAASRPAVLVTITDESEDLGTAEIYLAVQSSRFPADTRILLPVNLGDFAGCSKRYIALPFEVADGDNLIFNLIDEDGLSESQENVRLDACQTSGYCLAIASAIYRPEIGSLVKPLTDEVSELLGQGIVLGLRDATFEPIGAAEFIVGHDRPHGPQLANQLTLLDSGSYSRGSLRVYFPSQNGSGRGREL